MQAKTNPLPHTALVSVIIPHLNRIEETRACCESLAKQSILPALILIVDNASTAHTEQDLAAACPNARVLRQARNLGFAAAVNVGIREALRDQAITHLWVLNNDTRCPPDTLERLLTTVEAGPRIGLAGCPMIEGQGTGDERTVAAGKNFLRPFMIPVAGKPDHVPDYLSGACLLIRRSTLEDIGLLDEDFFFFFEDADLSRRAIEAGWELAVCRETRIEHRGSSTIRSMSELEASSYRAGHIRYLRKHTSHARLRGLPPYLARLLLDIARCNLSAYAANRKGWAQGFAQSIHAKM